MVVNVLKGWTLELQAGLAENEEWLMKQIEIVEQIFNLWKAAQAQRPQGNLQLGEVLHSIVRVFESCLKDELRRPLTEEIRHARTVLMEGANRGSDVSVRLIQSVALSKGGHECLMVARGRCKSGKKDDMATKNLELGIEQFDELTKDPIENTNHWMLSGNGGNRQDMDSFEKYLNGIVQMAGV